MTSATPNSEASRKPFFSVCLPTYNRGYCLATAIQSVLDQDFRDFELLVCDNASTDNTQAVVESFDDPRIRAMHFADLVSMYANHNRCIEHAAADWIVFLHSDDVLLPDALQRIHELAVAHSPDVVYGPLPNRPADHTLIRDAPNLDFFFNHGMSPSGTAYNRSAVFKSAGFAEDNLIADHACDIRWSLEGRKMVHSDRQFASRDFGTNTTCHQMLYGQWNVIVNRCLAPHLASKSIRKRIEADTPNHSSAEVKYSVAALAVCGHPFAALSICLRERLFGWFYLRQILKACLIRMLGIKAFTRVIYGKRGLKSLD